jgi:hypothetical protein
MAYVIDRARAVRMSALVAILNVRHRRVRSRVVFRDNSLYHTLTRPRTFLRYAAEQPEHWPGLVWSRRRQGA